MQYTTQTCMMLRARLVASARAAVIDALLFTRLEVGKRLQQAHLLVSIHGSGGISMRIGLQHRLGDVLGGARAAGTLGLWRRLLGLARRLLALQFALWLRARGRLLAFPVAFGGLAHRRAHWLRGDAAGTAVGRRAYRLALGAVVLLAHVLRAANVALRLVAVHSAFGAGSLFALDLALRALADRVALGRAHRVVALPAALRMAVCLSVEFRVQVHLLRGHTRHQR